MIINLLYPWKRNTIQESEARYFQYKKKKPQHWWHYYKLKVYMNIIWDGAYNPDHSFDQRNGEPLFQEAIKRPLQNHVKGYVSFL